MSSGTRSSSRFAESSLSRAAASALVASAMVSHHEFAVLRTVSGVGTIASALACTEKDGGDDDDDGSGGDDDGATDGDGGDDGGADGGDGGGACSNIFPVDHVGRTLHYASSDEDTETELDWRMFFAGADTFDGQDAWRIDGDYSTTTPEIASHSWISFWYACDDAGVWILGLSQEQVATTSAGSSEYWGETQYTRPGLVAPRSVGPGSTWTQDAEYRRTDSAGNDDTYAFVTDYEVTDEAVIDVPVGSFEALEVTYSTAGEPYTYWVVEGVGTVLSGTSELVEIEE